MTQYLLRRLLLFIPTVFVVTALIFFVVHLFPGDVLDILAADSSVTKEQLDAERRRLGLDLPIPVQYTVWLSNIAQGDLGRSLWSGRPVLDDLMLRIPVTLELSVLSIFFSVLFGVPIGVYAAIKQDSWSDYALRGIAISGLSIPNFWLATMILLILSRWVGWIPPTRYTSLSEDVLGNLSQMLIPSILLGVFMSALVMRMTRTALLEILRYDYIRTARAKGLHERVVFLRHAFRNSLIPVVTIIGVEVTTVIGGSVIMESIFALPGIGGYVFQVVQVRDYPAVQAVNLVMASFIILVNLGVDVSLSYLDPRIRYG